MRLLSHSGLPGEDQPFLLLVIDSGVASKLHRHGQEAIALAAIRKLRRVPVWEAEGAELWVSNDAVVAPVCTPTRLKHGAHLGAHSDP